MTVSAHQMKKEGALKIVIAETKSAPVTRLTELAALTARHQNQILHSATGTPSVTAMRIRTPVRVIVRDLPIAAAITIANLN